MLETKIMGRLSDPIRLSELLVANQDELIELVRSNGLEGLIAKRTDSVYERSAMTKNLARCAARGSDQAPSSHFQSAPLPEQIQLSSQPALVSHADGEWYDGCDGPFLSCS